MKLGVISDTHISSKMIYKTSSRILFGVSKNCEILFSMLKPYFTGIEAVLHAGDITDIAVLDMLANFAPVYAVAGNMDPVSLKHKLNEKSIVEIENYRIGLIHGWGSPVGLEKRIMEKLKNEKLDCIVYGHSHHPYNEKKNGILLFNPGSPTDKRFAKVNTIGTLPLDENLWGEHIELKVTSCLSEMNIL